MQRNLEGCAICGSTWGDVWADVEGVRLFFCCELCVDQFVGLVQAIERTTGWDRLDALMIEGDRSGRVVAASRAGANRRFFVAFNSLGELRRFEELPVERRRTT